MDAILSLVGSLLVAAISLIGVIYTAKSNHSEIQFDLSKAQAITDTKIESLTAEVNKHNNFAERVPVIEEQIKVINHRLKNLEELEDR